MLKLYFLVKGSADEAKELDVPERKNRSPS